MDFIVEHIYIIFLILGGAFLLLGIFKKNIAFVAISIALFVCVAISQPKFVNDVKNAVVNFFDGGIDPLRDDDYHDVQDKIDGKESVPETTSSHRPPE